MKFRELTWFRRSTFFRAHHSTAVRQWASDSLWLSHSSGSRYREVLRGSRRNFMMLKNGWNFSSIQRPPFVFCDLTLLRVKPLSIYNSESESSDLWPENKKPVTTIIVSLNTSNHSKSSGPRKNHLPTRFFSQIFNSDESSRYLTTTPQLKLDSVTRFYLPDSPRGRLSHWRCRLSRGLSDFLNKMKQSICLLFGVSFCFFFTFIAAQNANELSGTDFNHYYRKFVEFFLAWLFDFRNQWH